jgi:dihydrodipicolinate synthase/N-acetylneuraminate lyase
MAEKEGPDLASSVITPYFISPNQERDFRPPPADRRRRRCRSLYNNPADVRRLEDRPRDRGSRLAEIPNILGVKDLEVATYSIQELSKLVPPLPPSAS